MNLAFLPAAGFVLGLAALAGALYALQRLRVRHREVPVVTTLFWKEAVEEARARVLVDRFRHPLAYALVLAIAALLWLAVAGPTGGGAPARDHVLLLDGSAAMARDGWFDAAVAALEADLEELDPDERAVILCGATPRTLLLPGEEALLLAHRLEGVAPEPAPATVAAEVQRLLAVDRARPLSVRVYGTAPLHDALDVEAMLDPEGDVHLTRAELELDPAANRGLVALGSAPAASGDPARVDVLVDVQGGDAGGLAAELDGAPLDGSSVRTEGSRVVLSDLPAGGGALSVALPGGDALALDDAATLRLPRRPAIRVALSEAAAPALEPVLSLDAGVALVAPGAPADVVCRLEGEAVGADLPALEFVPGDAQPEAFLVTWPGDDEGREALARAIDALAIEEVDATALAEEAGRPISVGVEPGDARRVRVWRELVSPSYDLLESRAWPLFVARTVRWLAGEDDTPAWVAAGDALAGDDRAYAGEAGLALHPAGAAFVPSTAGAWDAGAAGPTLHAALLDRDASADPPHADDEPVAHTADVAGAAGRGWDAVTWILLLALGLLGLEWWLHRTGRMP